MERSATAAVLVLMATLSALASPCLGFCIPPFGWHSKSLVERIQLGEADAVVLAKVEAVNADPESDSRAPYTADLKVECVFDRRDGGGGVSLPANLKDVRGFGGTWDCAETKVSVGGEYIVFLNLLEGGGATVAEVNLQDGAERALPSRLKKVLSYFPCEN